MERSLITNLLTIGRVVAVALVPSAKDLIPVAEAATETIKRAIKTANAQDAAEMEAVRGDLDAKIKRISAGVDETVAKLRGER